MIEVLTILGVAAVALGAIALLVPIGPLGPSSPGRSILALCLGLFLIWSAEPVFEPRPVEGVTVSNELPATFATVENPYDTVDHRLALSARQGHTRVRLRARDFPSDWPLNARSGFLGCDDSVRRGGEPAVYFETDDRERYALNDPAASLYLAFDGIAAPPGPDGARRDAAPLVALGRMLCENPYLDRRSPARGADYWRTVRR